MRYDNLSTKYCWKGFIIRTFRRYSVNRRNNANDFPPPPNQIPLFEQRRYNSIDRQMNELTDQVEQLTISDWQFAHFPCPIKFSILPVLLSNVFFAKNFWQYTIELYPSFVELVINTSVAECVLHYLNMAKISNSLTNLTNAHLEEHHCRGLGVIGKLSFYRHKCDRKKQLKCYFKLGADKMDCE